MLLLDLTLPTPEENLACDEALLDEAEEGGDQEVLRFWESSSYFVVVGSSNHVAREVNIEMCERYGVPVLRRRSGGGAVLQGPGCLNYCLILRMDGPCSTIAGTNSFVLGRHAEVLGDLLEKEVRHEGLTDLAIDGIKISGNSQRRRLRYLMFHGTFLLGFDLSLVEKYLRMPSTEPTYRGRRSHRDFLMSIPLPTEQIKEVMRTNWDARQTDEGVSAERIEDLVRTRYGLREWNLKL